MDNPPSNIQDIYRSQGWNDAAAINADIAAGGWKGKVGSTGGSSSSGGRTAEGIDMSQVPSVQEYVKSQFPAEDAALTALIGRMQGQEKPLDMYTRLAKEQGLPELQNASKTLTQQINGIEDYLDQVEPNVSARSRESIITEAQRQRLVQSEKDPYQERLGNYTRDLGRISGLITGTKADIGNMVNLGIQGNEQELAPIKLAYQATVDRNSRMLTGFTADRQTTIDALYDKLNRTRTLSDQEWQLANEIGKEERDYMRTLTSAAANLGINVGNETDPNKILDMIGSEQAKNVALERQDKQSQIANRNANGNGDVFAGTTPTTWTPTTPKPTVKPDLNKMLDPYGIFSAGDQPVAGSSATLR